MQYYKCRCGKTKSFGSISPANCRPCDECGTLLLNIRWKEEHRGEVQPHEWTTQYETVTGTPYKMCMGCHKRRPLEEVVDNRPVEKKLIERKNGTYTWVHKCDHCGEFAAAQWIQDKHPNPDANGSFCTRRCWFEATAKAEGRKLIRPSPNAKKKDY